MPVLQKGRKQRTFDTIEPDDGAANEAGGTKLADWMK